MEENEIKNKSNKKIIIVIVSVALIILIVLGVIAFAITKKVIESGMKNEMDSGIKSSAFSDELTIKDLKINDFKWEMRPTTISGQKCYEFCLTNNSEYDIIGVEINYKTKDNASENDLQVFNDFMKEHEGYIKEGDSPKGVTLVGSKNTLVKKGESVDNILPTLGYKSMSWYSAPSEQQYNLMEPSKLTLGIIGKDGKMKFAIYDFTTQSWSFDYRDVKLNLWPENEISSLIPKPECEYFILTSDETDDYLDFYIYGTDEAFYKEYISQVESRGFSSNSSRYTTYYTGSNQNGDSISIEFKNNLKRIEVYLR